MNQTLYIPQNMQQVSNIKYLFEKNDEYDWFFEKETNLIDVSLNTLFNSNNKQYMIVAEPGYGKTRLLKEIVIKSKEKDYKAFFIDAKKIKNSSIISVLKECKYLEDIDIPDEILQKKTRFKNTEKNFTNDKNTIVCIDALDEVSIHNLYELIEEIEDFIHENSNIKIFLSIRTHHLKKISSYFDSLDFKFITLQPFFRRQIKESN